MSKSKGLLANLMFFATAIIWGFAFVAQRQGSNHIGSFAFNGIRFALGAVSLIPVILIFDRKAESRANNIKLLWASALAGFVLYAASALQQVGIVYTQDSGKAGFITAIYTVLVPIACAVFFHQKISWNAWVGFALAGVGLYLLSVTGGISSVGMGYIILFIGSFFWAGHIIVVDRVVGNLSPLKFACAQFAFCALFSLLSALIFEGPITTEAVKGAAVPILYCGLASVGVAYTLQIVGQKYCSNATLAAIIFSTESVFAAIGGAILMGEKMSVRGYIGCAMIFAGIVISQLVLSGKDKKKTA